MSKHIRIKDETHSLQVKKADIYTPQIKNSLCDNGSETLLLNQKPSPHRRRLFKIKLRTQTKKTKKSGINNFNLLSGTEDYSVGGNFR